MKLKYNKYILTSSGKTLQISEWSLMGLIQALYSVHTSLYLPPLQETYEMRSELVV